MLTARNSSFASYVGTVVDIFYAAGLIIFAALIAYNHFRIITAPAPVELFEATMLYITGLIAHGHNPYTFALQPQSMDVYTPFYNIVMAPLTLLFGDTLQLHRLVNGICIVLSSGLLGLSARRLGARWIDCAAVGVIAYAALVFYSTPIASPNALGELLFLASVLVPWLCRWSGPGLVASAMCGILAFYTKQYCLVSLVIVSVYLFLAVSKTRAIVYACGAAGAFAASIAVVNFTCPYFLADAVFAMSNTTHLINRLHYATRQLSIFGRMYAGLLLLAVVWAAISLRNAVKPGRSWLVLWTPRILPLKAPLLNAPLSYFWLGFAISTAAILFWLGQNPGMFMSYLFQLMTPFLLLGLCNAPLLCGRWRVLAVPLYLLTLWQAYDFLPRNFDISVQGWQRLRTVVCASRDPLVASILVWPVLECGKPVHNAGHTGYFVLATPPDFLEPSDPSRRPPQMWRDYMNGLTTGVRDRRFDVLATVRSLLGESGPGDVDPSIVRRYYRETEQIPLDFSDRPGGGRYVVHIWRPKPASEIE